MRPGAGLLLPSELVAHAEPQLRVGRVNLALPGDPSKSVAGQVTWGYQRFGWFTKSNYSSLPT